VDHQIALPRHPSSAPPAAIPVTAAADRAVRALEQWRQAPPGDDGELRAAVCAFVAALRARGAAPQTAIVATKRLFAVAGIFPMGVAAHRDLAERAVRWCIEEYYRPAGGA
jgi:hypothetical protein